ncbi:MAG: methyltransferase [Opitutaceae bacterium]|nr:methyltransferase [Cytophagales bacterium]
MPQDYFQFKQFSVYQKGATLKICTDSCLFGAWVAYQLNDSEKVLDIGSGTGLLGLMFAQQNLVAKITGLEIDKVSADLTFLNFQNSPWNNRLVSVNLSIQEFVTAGKFKFDSVICNPPFFENQLLSVKLGNNLAKHSSELKREELIECVISILDEKGVFYVLLPPAEAIIFESLANESGLHLSKISKVKNFVDSHHIRYMMAFEKQKVKLIEEEIFIYSTGKAYSDGFKSLLQDYYLYL